MGYSCRTLLRDTLVRHSGGTLLGDTLVGLSSSSPDTPRAKVVIEGRELSASRSPDTPRTTVVLQGRQFSASSSTDCSAYSSCTTKSPVLSFQLHRLLRVLKLYYKVASSQLLAPQIAPRTKVVLPSHQFSPSSSPDTPRTEVVLQSRQCSPAFRALDTHDLRRGLRAHGTNRTLACISRTRHARSPQRVARAWVKSHSRLHFAHSTRAISAEGCASSLQNERFVRDFLKNSHVKVCKTSVSYETSSKSQAETPIGAHTHHAALPSSFVIPAPPNNIRSHANPNVTATFTSTTTHNLTIPCACHENRTSTPQSPHEVLRLPRKVTISSHVSFNKICTTPHVWNDFDPFRAHSHPPKSPFQLRLVTKTELRCHTLKRKPQWHGHIPHPKNTTLQTLIPMALRSKLRISQNAVPVQRNASRFSRDMSWSCKSQWNSGAN